MCTSIRKLIAMTMFSLFLVILALTGVFCEFRPCSPSVKDQKKCCPVYLTKSSLNNNTVCYNTTNCPQGTYMTTEKATCLYDVTITAVDIKSVMTSRVCVQISNKDIFSMPTSCTACPDGCAQCDALQCKRCIGVEWNGKCVEKCPNGTALADETCQNLTTRITTTTTPTTKPTSKSTLVFSTMDASTPTSKSSTKVSTESPSTSRVGLIAGVVVAVVAVLGIVLGICLYCCVIKPRRNVQGENRGTSKLSQFFVLVKTKDKNVRTSKESIITSNPHNSQNFNFPSSVDVNTDSLQSDRYNSQGKKAILPTGKKSPKYDDDSFEKWREHTKRFPNINHDYGNSPITNNGNLSSKEAELFGSKVKSKQEVYENVNESQKNGVLNRSDMIAKFEQEAYENVAEPKIVGKATQRDGTNGRVINENVQKSQNNEVKAQRDGKSEHDVYENVQCAMTPKTASKFGTNGRKINENIEKPRNNDVQNQRIENEQSEQLVYENVKGSASPTTTSKFGNEERHYVEFQKSFSIESSSSLPTYENASMVVSSRREKSEIDDLPPAPPIPADNQEDYVDMTNTQYAVKKS